MKIQIFIFSIALVFSFGPANAQDACPTFDQSSRVKDIFFEINNDWGKFTMDRHPPEDQWKKICDVAHAALKELASIKASLKQNRACKDNDPTIELADTTVQSAQDNIKNACR